MSGVRASPRPNTFPCHAAPHGGSLLSAKSSPLEHEPARARVKPSAAQTAILDKLQRDTFQYFLAEANPDNGLVTDNTRTDSPCSIAAVGLGLACYPVASERGFLTRAEAAHRVRTTLRSFREGEQSERAEAMGYKGFYYHFLDMETGRRAVASELSTVDSGFLFAGMLAAALYFDRDDPVEAEIRESADFLYRRADWEWARNGGATLTHGWRPESGFMPYRWLGYDEALLLYFLALGSPTHPIGAESYVEWEQTYRWKRIYDIEFLYAGPLFIHHYSHVWVDFRGIRDAYMRERGIDYFENSRRAAFIQQRYAIRNPRRFEGYGEFAWGFTASDGPGPATLVIGGVKRRFWDYVARGVPWGPDDGTISPWAVVASLPFAPEIVLPTIEHFVAEYPEIVSEHGFRCSFNPTFRRVPNCGDGWISSGYYGIDQGPKVLMIENQRDDLLWNLMKRSPYLVAGIRRAGFRGGWLEQEPVA